MESYPEYASMINEAECVIPEEIRHRRAWCPYKYELRDGKRTKIPYDARTGYRAKSNKPNTWSSFEEAYQAASTSPGYDGIEYILSGNDPYFLLDLDGCRNPETGEITPEVRQIIARFAGRAFIEISTSGRGIHVFGRAKKPGAEWCRRRELGVELYDWGRPVVFTGNVVVGSTSELDDCQDELDQVYFKYMPEHRKHRPEREPETPSDPVALPDEDLLQKAAASRYGEEFSALWAGDTSVTGGDHSAADYRLMKLLIFWTGGDEKRAIDLFDKSGLARRSKWRQREDYRHRTARRAWMACTSFYQKEHFDKKSKSEQLSAAVEDLRRRWWNSDWTHLVGTGERPNSMRGHTCRDAFKVLIDAAARHGEVVKDGIRVSLSRRTIAIRAATSLRTVHKAIKHMEAEGLLKFESAKSEGKPGSYFMRANVHQVQSTQGEEAPPCVEGGEGLRAPRLRWSSPGRKARRGMDEETRRVRDHVQPAIPGVKRLGKVRGALLDALEAFGGTATLQELCGVLQRSRPRDLRRRVLPMLEEAGILAVQEDTVALAENWLDRLESVREMGEEIEREKIERIRYERQREAFHRRRESQSDPHYANTGADGHIEDLRPVEIVSEEPSPEQPVVSGLAQAIRDYLDRNPHDSCQPAGWLANTLWTYDLYPNKASPAEAKEAIAELGGESYLRDSLKLARLAS